MLKEEERERWKAVLVPKMPAPMIMMEGRVAIVVVMCWGFWVEVKEL